MKLSIIFGAICLLRLGCFLENEGIFVTPDWTAVLEEYPENCTTTRPIQKSNEDEKILGAWATYKKNNHHFMERLHNLTKSENNSNAFVRFVYKYKQFLVETKTWLINHQQSTGNNSRANLHNSTLSRWINKVDATLKKLHKSLPPAIQFLLWKTPVTITDSLGGDFMKPVDVWKSANLSRKPACKVILTSAWSEFCIFRFIPVRQGKYFQIKNVKNGHLLFNKVKGLFLNQEERENGQVHSARKAADVYSTFFQINIRNSDSIEIKSYGGRPIFISQNVTRISGSDVTERKLFISNDGKSVSSEFKLISSKIEANQMKRAG